MLTESEEKTAHALFRQGWPIAAISRHLARDRATIRAYIHGGRTTAARRAAPGSFAPFEEYCRLRLAEQPHLRATELFEEVAALGYRCRYSSFTHALRLLRLRPECQHCATPGHRREAAASEARATTSLQAAAPSRRTHAS
ncbi:IS30 family transposase [Streptacidiphilus sp. MAP12-16]|uniref:terminase gpP N-terminus-related DNA-binding protein n=1 Tax=Streptacidiphilus sp. MAP12-16 TaxID=3156300 RepID=UPI003512CADC